MNKKIRHWKQHYDANKALVLMRNMSFNGVEMKAGDLLTEEMRAKLGPYKLKLWWEAQIIQIQDHVPAKPEVMAAAPAKQEEPKPEPKPERKPLGKKKAKKAKKPEAPKLDLPEGDL